GRTISGRLERQETRRSKRRGVAHDSLWPDLAPRSEPYARGACCQGCSTVQPEPNSRHDTIGFVLDAERKCAPRPPRRQAAKVYGNAHLARKGKVREGMCTHVSGPFREQHTRTARVDRCKCPTPS